MVWCLGLARGFTLLPKLVKCHSDIESSNSIGSANLHSFVESLNLEAIVLSMPSLTPGSAPKLHGIRCVCVCACFF